MKNKIQELYALEKLAGNNSCIHALHPTVKLLATLVFIITVISFDRYSFGRLVPYIFYPTILMALSETPYSMLLKRFLPALPFCFFAGAANIMFDRAPAFMTGGITVSYGVVSFFTILFRVYLCVMSVLILVSVTPFSQIVNSLRRLRIPHIFIIVLEMTYRYIGVLLEEVYSMYTAYSLRSSNAKGIEMKDMGSFAGQLLIRSFDRADRVYNAMKCRGYALQNILQDSGKLTANDAVFFAVTCILCTVFRFTGVNVLFAGIIGGLI